MKKKPSHALLRLDFSIKDEELSEADDDDFSIGRCEKFENYDLGVFAETPEIKMSDEKLVRLVFDRFVGATKKFERNQFLSSWKFPITTTYKNLDPLAKPLADCQNYLKVRTNTFFFVYQFWYSSYF